MSKRKLKLFALWRAKPGQDAFTLWTKGRQRIHAMHDQGSLDFNHEHGEYELITFIIDVVNLFVKDERKKTDSLRMERDQAQSSEYAIRQVLRAKEKEIEDYYSKLEGWGDE